MNRFAAAAATLTLFLGAAPLPAQSGDPLLKPVAPDYAARWLKSQPPHRIFGNTYLVGFAGLNVGLIHTNAGLILIDGALPQAVHDVEANIRQLGFDPRDIKFILSTEPHYDHASGLAALARDSGATVVASAWAARSLRLGRPLPDDPQASMLETFPAVTKIRVAGDGERIRLGDVTVTARATPGHTPGSMSWTWTDTQAGKPVRIAYVDSLTAPGYRIVGNPRYPHLLDDYRRSFAAVRALPCDLLITPHPDFSGWDYANAAKPHAESVSCAAYAERAAKNIEQQASKQKP